MGGVPHFTSVDIHPDQKAVSQKRPPIALFYFEPKRSCSPEGLQKTLALLLSGYVSQQEPKPHAFSVAHHFTVLLTNRCFCDKQNSQAPPNHLSTHTLKKHPAARSTTWEVLQERQPTKRKKQRKTLGWCQPQSGNREKHLVGGGPIQSCQETKENIGLVVVLPRTYPLPVTNTLSHCSASSKCATKEFCESPQCKAVCKPVSAKLIPTNSTRRVSAQSTPSDHVLLVVAMLFLLLCGTQPSSLCLFRVCIPVTNSFCSWHSAMQLLSVQGETTNSVPKFVFPSCFSSQGHLFNWFCKPLHNSLYLAAPGRC